MTEIQKTRIITEMHKKPRIMTIYTDTLQTSMIPHMALPHVNVF